jgi:hypothetical protein
MSFFYHSQPNGSASEMRSTPWLSQHSQGDSNVTGGAAAAVPQTKAIEAIVNVIARLIAPIHIIFVVALWRAKAGNRIVKGHCKGN